MKKLLFILIFIIILFSCKRTKILQEIHPEIITEYINEIIIDNTDSNIQDFDFSSVFDFDINDPSTYVELSFHMTKEQIHQYYQIIDALVDKTDSTELIPVEQGSKLTEKELDEIKQRRLFTDEIFENDLIIEKTKTSLDVYHRTFILPDGYFNFRNYHYRNNNAQSWETPNDYFFYWKNLINPLLSFNGFIILEKDLNVYDREDDLKVGVIKAGSVIRINHMGYESKRNILYIPWLNKYYVDFKEIEIINKLLNMVDYKIIDNKVYRFIDDLVIEIDIKINYTEDGVRYIRREFQGFYFWEYWCDYYFDHDGNFLKYGYEPYYGV